MFRAVASLGLAAGLIVAATPVGVSAQLPPECRNAAVDYWRAASYLRAADLEKISGLDWEQLGLVTDPAKVPQEFVDAFATLQPIEESMVDALRSATATEACDFHIDFDKGYMALLPHLAELRNAARALRIASRRELLKGNPDGAAERVAIAYRMTDHISGDGLLISSLVAGAITQHLNPEVAVLMDTGQLTDKGREVLLSALGSFDAADPFNFKGAVKGEASFGSDWVRGTFTGPDAGRQFLKAGLATPDSPPEMAARIAAMDGQALAKEVDRSGRCYEDALFAWDSPRAEQLLAVIDGRARSGEYGSFSALTAPAFSKAFAASERAEASLQAVVRRLREYQPPAPAAEPAEAPTPAEAR